MCNWFWIFISNSVGLHNCLVLPGGLVHVVRDVGRILTFYVICRILLCVEICKKILINSFIFQSLCFPITTILLHNVVFIKPI